MSHEIQSVVQRISFAVFLIAGMIIGRGCTDHADHKDQMEVLRSIRDRLPSPPSPETVLPPQPGVIP